MPSVDDPIAASATANWIMHSCGMIPDVRGDFEAITIAKSFLWKLVSYIGIKSPRRIARAAFLSALPIESIPEINKEIWWLSMEWDGYSEHIFGLLLAPDTSVDSIIAKKLQTLRTRYQTLVKLDEDGKVPPGHKFQDGREVGLYSAFVWRCYLVALSRLERIRASQPNASPSNE
jgi:hypothetical protein